MDSSRRTAWHFRAMPGHLGAIGDLGTKNYH